MSHQAGGQHGYYLAGPYHPLPPPSTAAAAPVYGGGQPSAEIEIDDAKSQQMAALRDQISSLESQIQNVKTHTSQTAAAADGSGYAAFSPQPRYPAAGYPQMMEAPPHHQHQSYEQYPHDNNIGYHHNPPPQPPPNYYHYHPPPPPPPNYYHPHHPLPQPAYYHHYGAPPQGYEQYPHPACQYYPPGAPPPPAVSYSYHPPVSPAALEAAAVSLHKNASRKGSSMNEHEQIVNDNGMYLFIYVLLS